MLRRKCNVLQRKAFQKHPYYIEMCVCVCGVRVRVRVRVV